jgi:hypothetical protein
MVWMMKKFRQENLHVFYWFCPLKQDLSATSPSSITFGVTQESLISRLLPRESSTMLLMDGDSLAGSPVWLPPFPYCMDEASSLLKLFFIQPPCPVIHWTE